MSLLNVVGSTNSADTNCLSVCVCKLKDKFQIDLCSDNECESFLVSHLQLILKNDNHFYLSFAKPELFVCNLP